jgi:hypothetical protein
MLLDQADCTGAHELRRGPNNGTSLHVLDAVDGAEKSLERVNGRVGMVCPKAVSLHVADNEQRGYGNVFDTVG